MDHESVWIACKPLSLSPSTTFLKDATHVSFGDRAPATSPALYSDGYVERRRAGRPVRVLLRRMDGPISPPDSQGLSRFDAENAPKRVISPWGLLATSAGHVVVAPWVNGLALETIEKRLRMLGTPLPTILALEVAEQLLEILTRLQSLGNAHSRNSAFVHGALRPSTVFLGIDGQVHVIDVGDDAEHKSKAKRSREPWATTVLPYLAPEQLSDGGKESPRTDIYSVATILYELIAGKPLFNGSSARRELEIRAGFGVPERLQVLDAEVPGLSRILARALSLSPGDRFETPERMREALRSWKRGGASPELAALVQRLKVFKPPVHRSRSAWEGPAPVSRLAATDPGGNGPRRAAHGRTKGHQPAVRHSQGGHGPGSAAEHRGPHLVLGLIGAVVAIAAYLLVSTPTPAFLHTTTHIDRAIETQQGPDDALLRAPAAAVPSRAR